MFDLELKACMLAREWDTDNSRPNPWLRGSSACVASIAQGDNTYWFFLLYCCHILIVNFVSSFRSLNPISVFITLHRTGRFSGNSAWTRIQAVVGSNLGRDIGQSDWSFCGFSQIFQQNAQTVSHLNRDPFIPNACQFIIHQVFYHSTLYSLDRQHSKIGHNIAFH
jgi:hypothetical protein